MVCELCLFLKFYFIIWGRAGSSSLLGLFSRCGDWGLLQLAVKASQCGDFSLCGVQALRCWSFSGCGRWGQ